MPNEVMDKVDALGNAWENFKQKNDERLKELEKKGSVDPLTQETLKKLNDTVEALQTQVTDVKANVNAVSRPNLAGTTNAEDAERKTAFVEYLRKGKTERLEKAMSIGSDPDGGYLVTPSISSDVIKTIFETSPIRSIASVETISSDSLDVAEDTNQFSASWTAETATRSDTNNAQLGKKSIFAFELAAQPKASQRLIDDAAIDIEAWLSAKLADIFGRTENTAFVAGTGVGQPRGFLTYASGTSWNQIEQITSGTSGSITADGLIKLYYALKDDYAMNGTFLMSRASVQASRLLKDSTNQYIWSPGLSAGSPDTLLGRPVVKASDMPTPAANSLSVAFGDFKRGYKIVDRKGMTLLRDPFTDKPNVRFYTTKRVGGDVTNFEAIKLLKLA